MIELDISKSEARSPKQYQNSNVRMTETASNVWEFEPLDLLRFSKFGFRIFKVKG